MDYNNQRSRNDSTTTFQHTSMLTLTDDPRTKASASSPPWIVRTTTYLRYGTRMRCHYRKTNDHRREKCQRIIDTKTNRAMTVCFNYRYAPMRKVKEILASSNRRNHLVHFGGRSILPWRRLLQDGIVTRETRADCSYTRQHTIDLVNWWIDSEDTVFAMGDLRFYGRETPKNAESGITAESADRYCKKDPFALKVNENDKEMMGLYYNAEKCDGYFETNPYSVTESRSKIRCP